MRIQVRNQSKRKKEVGLIGRIAQRVEKKKGKEREIMKDI